MEHLLTYLLAYIDPGIGSIIIQVLIATIAGIGLYAKFFWHRILMFLGIRKLPEDLDAEK